MTSIPTPSLANNNALHPQNTKEVKPNTPNTSNNHSPLVKLSIDGDRERERDQRETRERDQRDTRERGRDQEDTNFEDLANKNIDVEDVTGLVTKLHMDNKKLVSKFVEVTTRIVYYYEDGTSKEVVDKKSQTFINTNK
jgi:hypothetical protein